MRQNKRELIQAVFHNEKADRIPVGFWHHFLQDEVGADAFSHPQLTEKALEGQADFYQAVERLNESAALNMELAKSGIPVKGISITSEELETYFLNLTGGADHA